MNAETLEIKLTGLKEKIEKRITLNAKLDARVQKIAAAVKADDSRKNRIELDIAIDNRADSGKKLIKLQSDKAALEAKLAAAREQEAKINTILGDALLQAEAEMIAAGVEYDMKRAREIRAFNDAASDYKETVEKYGYTAYDECVHASEERLLKHFTAIEKAAARHWIIDFYYRVAKKVGNVTEVSGLKWGGRALNGFVKGDKGTAIVETIEAGGYNIQRWHLRVLVK